MWRTVASGAVTLLPASSTLHVRTSLKPTLLLEGLVSHMFGPKSWSWLQGVQSLKPSAFLLMCYDLWMKQRANQLQIPNKWVVLLALSAMAAWMFSLKRMGPRHSNIYSTTIVLDPLQQDPTSRAIQTQSLSILTSGPARNIQTLNKKEQTLQLIQAASQVTSKECLRMSLCQRIAYLSQEL